ncbi:MAG: hypothetical protein NVSMB12_06660 [Acidimicrobiales bacterium]
MTEDGHQAAPAAPGASRVGVLAARLRSADARSTWPVAVGALLVPAGIAIILLAWYGSAHTPYIQQQIPYLVSGSFIGLGLMVLGGLLYWSHWLYRVYDQAHLHHVVEMQRQEVLFERLIEAVAWGRTPAGDTDRSGRDAGLVATATGSNAHYPDCPIVRRHPAGLRPLTLEQARVARPCRICNAGVKESST